MRKKPLTVLCAVLALTALLCSGAMAADDSETAEPSVPCETHEVLIRGAQDATCTQAGATGEKYCAVCGVTLEESQEIPPLGHSWATTDTPTEATCTKAGNEHQRCIRCQEERDVITPRLGHDWDDGTVVTPAACTATGVTKYTCQRCGKTRLDATPMLGHSWDSGATLQSPTCTEEGIFRYCCETCGETRDEALAALGHEWDNGTVVKAASRVKSGVLRLTCLRCGGTMEQEIPATGEGNPFRDVPDNAYYTASVLWALDNGITVGIQDDQFAPEETCTRAQVVTMLWRAAGSPEPESTSSGFADVSSAAYYASAVCWAVENGITRGTSAKTFSPDDPCTRAQVVTMLWRAAGSPEPQSEEQPFSDLKDVSYALSAIRWAVEQGITTGTSAKAFSPSAACTRAQVVTFLYRADKNR